MKTRAFVGACIVCLTLATLPGVSRGADWAPMPSGTTQHLTGIWGSSANDVFAVGFGGTILHFDGASWSAMSSGTTEYLYALWGAAANDVFAVGNNGTILHYDGSTWSAMTSGTTGPLTAIWGSSASDVFAIGDFHTVLRHFDGSTWVPVTKIADGKPLPFNITFQSIWGASSSNVFVAAFYQDVDENAQLGASHFLILHYDGSAWTTMVSQSSGGFGDIWGSSSSDIYAFGLGLHYDGAAWTKAEGLPGLLGDAWGSSSNDIYVCEGAGGLGVHGVIAHFDGTAWSTMVSGTTAGLAGIWGFSPTDAFVVGAGGTILRRSCTTATPDAFRFLDRTGAALSRTASAAGVQVAGICTTAPISVSGGEYAINGGGYTNAPGTVSNGSTVSVRTVAAGTHAATASATLTIGDTSDTFSVTTQGARGETRKKNDFDGDGRSEIGCYEPASGTWFQSRSEEGYRETLFGFAGTVPITGDFDGDGLAGLGSFLPRRGSLYLLESTAGFSKVRFGIPGAIPVAGDFDGDGRDDAGVFQAQLGTWYLSQSTAGFREAQFGYAGTVPVVGDFDGDGRDDFGIYDAPLGKWYLFKSTEGYGETQFGYAGTIPLVGDFDGDGRADIGCYDQHDPLLGSVFLFKSAEGFWQTAWTPKAEPVVGDFDGDGRDDVALYTDRLGQWDLILSSGALGREYFGFPGTTPLGYVNR